MEIVENIFLHVRFVSSKVKNVLDIPLQKSVQQYSLSPYPTEIFFL